MIKKIYFTSDWHCGHENVIKFDDRPFRDIEHMHRVLINNYNSTVGTNDICYFLGDMGLCKGDIIKDVVQQLNGTKILILGNHDRAKGPQFWYKCGFVSVMNQAAITIGKELVTMTHCPLRGITREDVTGMRGAKEGEHWHGESRHTLYSIPNFGQYHLHGHTHAPNHGKSSVIQCKQYDVGVVGNGYKPVSSSKLESWIAKFKKGNRYEKS